MQGNLGQTLNSGLKENDITERQRQFGKNKINEGDKIEGTITRIKHFGAFVEVFPGVEALLPNNEVVDYQNKNNCILASGDKINTTIIKFNPDDRRISLSLNED